MRTHGQARTAPRLKTSPPVTLELLRSWRLHPHLTRARTQLLPQMTVCKAHECVEPIKRTALRVNRGDLVHGVGGFCALSVFRVVHLQDCK